MLAFFVERRNNFEVINVGRVIRYLASKDNWYNSIDSHCDIIDIILEPYDKSRKRLFKCNNF